MEKSNGPRLFEREWISILTTSDQHRIHSKLHFRKNMPFSGSVRYLFLRRKSATKDPNAPSQQTHVKQRQQNSTPIFFNFEPRLEIWRSKVDTQIERRRFKLIHSRSKSLGPLDFSILYKRGWLTKASRRMAVMTSSFCIKLITIL